MDPVRGHIVSLAYLLWGHTKPFCALLSRIVRQKPIHVTLFTPVAIIQKVKDEIDKQFTTGVDEAFLRNLIRVVGLESAQTPFDLDLLHSGFRRGYQTILERKALESEPGSGAYYEAAGKPQLVLINFLGYGALQTVRSLSGASIPVFTWNCGAAFAVMMLYGPESLGGAGDLASKLECMKFEEGEDIFEAADKVYRRTKGEVIRIPGLPEMYDYENIPQISLFKQSVAFALKDAFRQATHVYDLCLNDCDGVIHASSHVYEPEAFAQWALWLGDRPVVAAGSQAHINDAAIELEESKSAIGHDVRVFLDNAQREYGENTVIYVAFGTVFWTSQPEKLWAFVDVMIDLCIPFLLSHASPFAVVPEDVKSRVEASGLGYMSSWLPQQMILRHKACGWILTHCGHNSVMEALAEGIPMICWPFDADQPANAAHVTSTHDVAYELFEVRCGHGLRPIRRLNDWTPSGTLDAVRKEAMAVLEKTRSEDGERKRANARRLGEDLARGWEEGGEHWEELKKVTRLLD